MLMDPFSVALGIGGIASNLISNARNQSNFNRQLAFTDRQQRAAMDYNSEFRKVQRLRAAGLNPQLLGLQSGMISAQSAPSPVPATPLDMNGLSSISTASALNLSNQRVLDSQAQKNISEATGQDIENKFSADQFMAKIHNMRIDSGLKRYMTQNYMLTNKFLDQSMADRLWQQKMESQRAQAEDQAAWYTVQYLPQHLQSEIDLLMAQAKQAYQTGRATLQEAHAAIMRATNEKHAFEAQYGGSPGQRKQFFKATLEYLTQQRDTEAAREFDYSHTFKPAVNSAYTEEYSSWHGNKYNK